MTIRGTGLLSVVVLALSCSAKGTTTDRSGGLDGPAPSTMEGAAGASTDAASSPAPFVSEPVGTDGADGTSTSGDPSCEAIAAGEAHLQPVRLAFAFDVSGSMGKLDYPWHDPTLKWEPVVAATKAFFTDPASAGISASLTFFPIDADQSERCDPANYDDPDVPMTPLPSDAFGAAIDAITPTSTDEWRGGTPTLAVIQGTLTFIEPLAANDSNARYAIVLVSDGYPQGCDDNSIQSVVDVVVAVSDSIPTYVIGVENPPGGPDTVSNLNDIAVAGGTDHAFMIQTGDPEQTKDDFGAAVHTVRTASVSCDFSIPPPPDGYTFDPQKANVTYTSGTSSSALAYDDQCTSLDAWRYDDPTAPTRMVLCDSTCATVQSDPDAVLHVEFGCERREIIR